ncbi:MAG TPA: DUF3147 family protein [Candidatus Thermoplasmatota archaeon]|nr:DUF3147 family protein [Candidatus Thermoplasmatota archaeon]
MISLSFEFLIPFLTAAATVILITVVAERYGTKTGGILGTLPSTILIAYLFISYNEGIHVATQSVAVVPAEMGANVIFLLLFALFAYRSFALALAVSISIWTMLSLLLLFFNLENLLISFLIFSAGFAIAMLVLEWRKKIKSVGKVQTCYTPLRIILRGLFAGIIIGTAVLLSNVGAVLSGILSAFPVIFLSTMIIAMRMQGPDFAAGMAKSMIFGSPSVVCYALAIYFFYPAYGILIGTIGAYVLSFIVTMILYALSKRLA